MARPDPRIFEVTGTIRLTPNMHRLTLGGEALEGFPKGQSGGYIKLMFPNPEGVKPILRTYTIRRETYNGLEIDFALHGGKSDSGPATNWAIAAKVGDKVKVGGPGPAKPLPLNDGPFLLVGDMTALPAISVNLEEMSEQASGQAIILIRDVADKQKFDIPEKVSITWLVDPDLGADPSLLANAVRELPNLKEVTFAWVACEFEAMKLIRQYLRAEQNFGNDRLYISSYWKRGLIEDDHKQIKRADAEAEA